MDYFLEETYNEDPCYASGNVMIDKLKREYDIYSWSSSPKNFCWKCSDFDPSIVNCEIITCMLCFQEPYLEIYQDSIALVFANIFWSDYANINVDTLYLELINNNCYLEYCISKDDLGETPQSIQLINYEEIPKYKIINEFYGTTNTGYYEAKSFNLILELQEDFNNIDSLSLIIKDKYAQLLKNKNVDELKIEINIRSPLCNLCTRKHYEYFFELTTNRVKAYRKTYNK